MILLPHCLLCELATDHGTSSEMHRGFGSVNPGSHTLACASTSPAVGVPPLAALLSPAPRPAGVASDRRRRFARPSAHVSLPGLAGFGLDSILVCKSYLV